MLCLVATALGFIVVCMMRLDKRLDLLVSDTSIGPTARDVPGVFLIYFYIFIHDLVTQAFS